MTQGQRHRNILDYLEQHGELIVEDACKLFDASPATIRRDFNEMVEEGLAEKTWGGIIKKLNGSITEHMLPLSYRQEQFTGEKRRIAEKAASLVQDGDVIMIDGGTTTFQMAPFLANKKIRVITNSILIAYQIDKDKKSKQGAEVFIAGGMLYPESGLLVGPQTNAGIKSYNANWAFLSAGAIDESGPTNSNQMVVETEQAIIAQCDKVILLADHSKMGKRNMCRVCDWANISILITNNEPSVEEIVKNLHNKVQVELV